MRTAQATLDRDYAIEEADSYADALEAWAATSTLPWAGLEAASARAGADAVLARYNAEETLVTEEAEADETYAGSQAQAAAVRSGELAGAESERVASRSDAAVTLATANRDAASQQGTSNAAPAAAPKPLEPAAQPQPETSRAGEDDFTTNRQSDKDGTRLVDFDATPPVRDVDEGGTVKEEIDNATSAERQNESVVGDQRGGSVLVGDPAEDRQRQLAGEWADGMMESTPTDQWDEAAEAFIANAGLSEAIAEDLRKLVAERQGWEAQRKGWTAPDEAPEAGGGLQAEGFWSHAWAMAKGFYDGFASGAAYDGYRGFVDAGNAAFGRFNWAEPTGPVHGNYDAYNKGWENGEKTVLALNIATMLASGRAVAMGLVQGFEAINGLRLGYLAMADGSVVLVVTNVAGATFELTPTLAAQMGLTAAEAARIHDLLTNARMSAQSPGEPVGDGNTGQSAVGTYVRRIDRLKHPLDPDHVKAARLEKMGQSTGIDPSTGRPWNHLMETRNAMHGARKHIVQLKKFLSDPSLSPSMRSAMEAELKELSTLLDNAESILGELAR